MVENWNWTLKSGEYIQLQIFWSYLLIIPGEMSDKFKFIKTIAATKSWLLTLRQSFLLKCWIITNHKILLCLPATKGGKENQVKTLHAKPMIQSIICTRINQWYFCLFFRQIKHFIFQKLIFFISLRNPYLMEFSVNTYNTNINITVLFCSLYFKQLDFQEDIKVRIVSRLDVQKILQNLDVFGGLLNHY